MRGKFSKGLKLQGPHNVICFKVWGPRRINLQQFSKSLRSQGASSSSVAPESQNSLGDPAIYTILSSTV